MRACDGAVLRDRIWGAVAALFAAVAIFAALSAVRQDRQDGFLSNPPDFRAFYCAGAALDAKRDPYRVEPIRTCQRRVLLASHLELDEQHPLFAPLPPYALALFAVLARLPFWAATRLWVVLNLAALIVALFSMQRLTGLRVWSVVLAMLASVGFASLVLGQVVPLVVAALGLAALAVRRGDGRVAAVAAALAALEPHVALPLWLGLALLVPRARVPLVVAGGVLLALSFSFGLRLNVEYVASVVPAHARAEIANFGAQYSLSALLRWCGVPIGAALVLGSASYVIMLATGLLIATALVRRTCDSAFAVLAPPAAVLLGGPFIHGHQMAVALPFALLLLATVPHRTFAHAAVLGAIVALAIPWDSIADMSLVADRLPGPPPRPAVVLPLPAGDEPIERSYTAFMDHNAGRADFRTPFEQLLWKLPVWAALIALLAIAGDGARSRARFGLR